MGCPLSGIPANYTYFKEETGKIMAGFFEPRGQGVEPRWHPRETSRSVRSPEDWDHVGPIFERAMRRVPALADAGIQLFFNGPEAFTPDGVYYLGEGAGGRRLLRGSKASIRSDSSRQGVSAG